MKKAQLCFQFCRTEKEAQELCARLNGGLRSRYITKKYPAHYTPWQSKNAEDGMHFVVLCHVAI